MRNFESNALITLQAEESFEFPRVPIGQLSAQFDLQENKISW